MKDTYHMRNKIFERLDTTFKRVFKNNEYCYACGMKFGLDKDSLGFRCNYCKRNYCPKHILPYSHSLKCGRKQKSPPHGGIREVHRAGGKIEVYGR